MDELTNGLHKDIGRLEGKVDRLCESVSVLNKSVSAIAEQKAKVEHLERDVIQHDKRIVKLEAASSVIQRFEKHLEEDRPIEEIAGKWALRALFALAGVAGYALLDKLPRIIEFLNK